ncbi:hypothetical protein OROMI_009213 [Orobanche minor]
MADSINNSVGVGQIPLESPFPPKADLISSEKSSSSGDAYPKNISTYAGIQNKKADQIKDRCEIPQKKLNDSCSGSPSDPISAARSVSSLDLGRFLFPGVFSVKASAAGPKIIGSGQILNTSTSDKIAGGSASFPVQEGTRNLLKDPVPQKSGESGFCLPPDPRDAVSRETWARFPEAVWKDAAVIVSEILKQANPGGSDVLKHPPTDVEGAGDSSSSSSFWEEAAKLVDRLEKGENLADGEFSSAPPQPRYF